MSGRRSILKYEKEMKSDTGSRRLDTGNEILLSERIGVELYSLSLRERLEKYSSENSHSERMQYDSPQYSRDSYLIYQETRSKVLPSTMDESSQITK
jgi:hypothetical protein